MKFTAEDKPKFEQVFQSMMRIKRPTEGEPEPAAAVELKAQVDALAEIVRSSDTIQHHITLSELAVMKSRNEDAFGSILLTYLILGINIGGALAGVPASLEGIPASTGVVN
jgi:hypothetical protein